MKLCPQSPKSLLAALLSALFALLSLNAARAQLLLTIDDSIPGNTIISATGAFPATTVSPGLIAYGIDLAGLFTANVGLSDFTVLSSSLTTGDSSSGPIFTQASGDQLTLPGDVDLNLYHNDTPDTISFTTGQAAFKGTLTLDLSSLPLPALGTKGDILTGYSGTSPDNTFIGQWEIVPEPSSGLLMLGGLGVVLVMSLRRGSRRA